MDNNKKLLLLIVLAVGAILSLGRGLMSTLFKHQLLASHDVVADQPCALKSDSALRQARKSSFASFGRNPFTLAPVASSGDLVLEGILWDEKNPMAIINNNIVKKGETIGSYVVIKIQSNKVVVSDGTKERELSLAE